MMRAVLGPSHAYQTLIHRTHNALRVLCPVRKNDTWDAYARTMACIELVKWFPFGHDTPDKVNYALHTFRTKHLMPDVSGLMCVLRGAIRAYEDTARFFGFGKAVQYDWATNDVGKWARDELVRVLSGADNNRGTAYAVETDLLDALHAIESTYNQYVRPYHQVP